MAGVMVQQVEPAGASTHQTVAFVRVRKELGPVVNSAVATCTPVPIRRLVPPASTADTHCWSLETTETLSHAIAMSDADGRVIVYSDEVRSLLGRGKLGFCVSGP